MQRKRHINFKDFLSTSSTSGSILNLGQRIGKSNLHSIPTLLPHNRSSDKQMKNKSNVLSSIPCVCILALLLVGAVSLLLKSTCYAYDSCPDGICVGTVSDSTAISPLPTTTPSASLSLSNPNMTSSAITPGNTTTVSTNVTVNVGNAESYSLTLKVDSTTLSNGNTTINAGNVVNDNTWGYKWDNATSYTAPSTTAQTLTVPTLSNNAVNFTKNLTFGAKFSNNAEAGHYKGSGTLSLVATPKAATYTLADLTQMQQLSLAPEACANTPYLSGLNYSAEYTLTDVRDNSTYTVRKLGDGKCWMTQNLNLNTLMPAGNYLGGRQLGSATSDIDSSFILPTTITALSSTDFSATGSYRTTAQSYKSSSDNYAYYNWYAATGGTGDDSISVSGTNASGSICPKGWTLPKYSTTTSDNDFYTLFDNMGLSITGTIKLGGNVGTSWTEADLIIVQSSPYNFDYTGRICSGTLSDTAYGNWWSHTVHGNGAYALSISAKTLYPGTDVNSGRQCGLPIRCIAK